MSKRLMLSFMALLGMAFAGDIAAKPKRATVMIPVKGMACQEMCGTRVMKALKTIDGVEQVAVSAAEGHARVTYVEAKVTPERLVAAVNKLGFEAGAPKVEKQSSERR